MMQTASNGHPTRHVVLAEQDTECTHSTDVTTHGFPDRVELLEDGTCLIVDFKTGRKVKHIENDFMTCFQVIVYAYLMESMGYKVSGAEFRYIRLGQTVKCKYDKEMKKKLSEALTQFKKTMESGEFLCCNSLDDTCSYCQYLWVCNKDSEEDYWRELFNEDDGED
jgi:CRISPR/Cas system-associated exonuclease Cas4 (RecB family)